MTLFPLALVYDWGENGTIIEYAASHPDASRMALVRVAVAAMETEWSPIKSTFNSCRGSRRDYNGFIPWTYPTGI